jgi:hypothetical protein
MKRMAIKAATGLSLLTFCAMARAAVIHVPGDQPTIQAGVNAAGIADTVLVDHGTYFENVKISFKSVTLASRFIVDGDPQHISQTLIDGSSPASSDTGSCIILLNSPAGVVEGFTLTGGTGTKWLDQSDGLIYREGGGILVEGGDPTLAHNLFLRNEATEVVAGVKSAGGGGIRVGFGAATLWNNVFAFNRGLYGAGVVIFMSNAILRNNVVYRNKGGADFGGGGLWLVSGPATVQLENNTIEENRSDLDGGGVLIWNQTVVARNNIIRDNTATSSGNDIRLRAGGILTLTYSDVLGGFAGTGNIDQAPLFGPVNFELTAPSPCVDTGDPDAAYDDMEDTGNPGFAAPPSLGGLRNDQGAYGGPLAQAFAPFNMATLSASAPTIQFDTLELGSTDSLGVQVIKSGFGVVSIDSVRAASANIAVSPSGPALLGPSISDSLHLLTIAWTANNSGPLTDTIRIYYSGVAAPGALGVAVTGMASAARGDVNNSGSTTSADIIYLVNYVFKGAAPPYPVQSEGDVNCNGVINSADIIYLVNYVFKGGPVPGCA